MVTLVFFGHGERPEFPKAIDEKEKAEDIESM
jgi:hypothetical protein